MRTTRRRAIAWGGITAAVLLAAAPALSARGPGSITITSLVANQPAAGVVEVDWAWRSGTDVSSTDVVNITASPDGVTWRTVAARVPIRTGTVTWDTATFDDGAYTVRARVHGEQIWSILTPIFVDNTKPEVEITRPTTNQVVVDDDSPEVAIVAGKATLEADATDALTGVESVAWYLDDGEEPIGTGASYTHDFSQIPGPHTLKVVATDFAGNVSDADTLDIVALPGPSVAEGDLPEPPEGPDTGELPDVPDAGELPEAPGEGDLPDTGELPTVPNPEDLPDAPDVPTLPDPNDPPEVPPLP